MLTNEVTPHGSELLFAHPMNIRVGLARVIYDESRAGWALPGMRTTSSVEEARAVAERMADLIEHAPFPRRM